MSLFDFEHCCVIVLPLVGSPSSSSGGRYDKMLTVSNLWSLSPSEYVKLLNITTGKTLALLLVACFGIYHGLLRTWSDGVTPCKGLLVDGMYKGDFWQPWGCMMHKYTLT